MDPAFNSVQAWVWHTVSFTCLTPTSVVPSTEKSLAIFARYNVCELSSPNFDWQVDRTWQLHTGGAEFLLTRTNLGFFGWGLQIFKEKSNSKEVQRVSCIKLPYFLGLLYRQAKLISVSIIKYSKIMKCYQFALPQDIHSSFSAQNNWHPQCLTLAAIVY